MELSKHALHYLEKAEYLYSRVEPSEPIYYAWISVITAKYQKATNVSYDPSKNFIVRWYEVPIKVYDDVVVAGKRRLKEYQARNFMRLYVNDVEHLVRTLEKMGFGDADLQPYWRCDFPFESF